MFQALSREPKVATPVYLQMLMQQKYLSGTEWNVFTLRALMNPQDGMGHRGPLHTWVITGNGATFEFVLPPSLAHLVDGRDDASHSPTFGAARPLPFFVESPQ